MQEEILSSLGNLRSFTFKELYHATNSYSSKNIVGAGGFGNVYKGKLEDGTVVAVKRLKDVNGKTGELQFRTELEMISLAVHRNLLRLIGYCATPNERLLVYPYMSNGSVASRLRGWFLSYLSTSLPLLLLLLIITSMNFCQIVISGLSLSQKTTVSYILGPPD